MTAPAVLLAVAGACFLLALLALRRVRRTARRLEELTQSYWQLRYEVEELRLRLQGRQNEGGQGVQGALSDRPSRPPTGDAFVPLASLKR
jgi:hypothetical protein